MFEKINYSTPVGDSLTFAKASIPSSYASLDNTLGASSILSNNRGSTSSYAFFNSNPSNSYLSSANSFNSGLTQISSILSNNPRLSNFSKRSSRRSSRFGGSRRYGNLVNRNNSTLSLGVPAKRMIAPQPYQANIIQGPPYMPQPLPLIEQEQQIDLPSVLPQQSRLRMTQIDLPDVLPQQSRVRKPFRFKGISKTTLPSRSLRSSMFETRNPNSLSRVVGDRISNLARTTQSLYGSRLSNMGRTAESIYSSTPTLKPLIVYPGQKGRLRFQERQAYYAPQSYPDQSRININMEQSIVRPFYPDQSRISVDIGQQAPFYPGQSRVNIDLNQSYDGTRRGISGTMRDSGFQQRKILRQSAPVFAPPPQGQESDSSQYKTIVEDLLQLPDFLDLLSVADNNEQIIHNFNEDNISSISSEQYNLKKELQKALQQNAVLKQKLAQFTQQQRIYWKTKRQDAWNGSVFQMLNQSYDLSPFQRNIQFFTQVQHGQQEQFQKNIRHNRSKFIFNPALIDHLIGVGMGAIQVKHPQLRVLAQFMLKCVQMPDFDPQNVNNLFEDIFFRGNNKDEKQIQKMKQRLQKQLYQQGFFKGILLKDDVAIIIENQVFPLPPRSS